MVYILDPSHWAHNAETTLNQQRFTDNSDNLDTREHSIKLMSQIIKDSKWTMSSLCARSNKLENWCRPNQLLANA